MSSTLLGGAAQAKAAVARRFQEGWDEYPAPAGKAGRVKFGWESAEPSDAPHIHRLRSDLANTYYWTGAPSTDYLFFVANWHPLLGMFLSHPNHPWSKRERVLMFLISLALTLVPSALLARLLHHGGVGQVFEVVLTLVFVTLPDTIIGVVLYQLSVADTKCPGCATCISGLEGCLAAVTLIGGALSTIVASSILGAVGADWFDLLEPLIMGKLYSYATWFPIFLLLPCIGFALVWRGERKALMTSSGGSDEQNLLVA
jgi:hypothetical protein